MPPSRRQVLATCGIALTAGCSSVPSLGDEESTPEEPAPFLREPTDWPLPNHDAANTNAAPAEAAPDGELEQQWSVEFDLDELDWWSSPVVADGQVYVALYLRTGARWPIRLLAYDARTGTEQWRFERGDEGTRYMRSQVSVAGETVFFDGNENEQPILYALNAADGSELWSKPLDLSGERTALPAHGQVYISESTEDDRSRFAALDARTGAERWSRVVDRTRPLAATAGPETVYFSCRGSGGQLYALDPQTGEPRWMEQHIVQSLAPLRGTHLYTADRGQPKRRTVAAFDVEQRTTTWSKTRNLQRELDDGGYVNGRFEVAAATDELVFVLTNFYGGFDDRLTAYDRTNRETRWTLDPALEDSPTMFNRPIVAGDQVYVTDVANDRERSTLRVLDLSTGEQQARYDLPWNCYEKPIAAGGRVFALTYEGLLAFGSE